MGELYSQQDQLALAERHYLEALPLYGEDHVNAGIAWCNLARNAIALRTEVKAVHYLRGLTAMAGRTYAVPVAVSLLSNCAGLAALRNEWALALRWSGAADSTRERHGLADFHVDVRFHAASMAPVREALGAIDAAATLEAGRALDVDTALHEAEAWLDALPPDERTP